MPPAALSPAERECEPLAKMGPVGKVRELVVVGLTVDAVDLGTDPARDPTEQRHEDDEEHEQQRLEHASYPQQRLLGVPLDGLVRLDDRSGAARAGAAADRGERLEHLRPRGGAGHALRGRSAHDRATGRLPGERPGRATPDELVIGGVRHEPVRANERDAERVVRDEVGAEEPVQLAPALRGDAPSEVARCHFRAQKRGGDEACLPRRGPLRLGHREAADDDEDERSGERERQREDDGEAQHEARRSLDREEPLLSLTATGERHQRFGLPRIGPRIVSTVSSSVPTGSSSRSPTGGMMPTTGGGEGGGGGGGAGGEEGAGGGGGGAGGGGGGEGAGGGGGGAGGGGGGGAGDGEAGGDEDGGG